MRHRYESQEIIADEAVELAIKQPDAGQDSDVVNELGKNSETIHICYISNLDPLF